MTLLSGISQRDELGDDIDNYCHRVRRIAQRCVELIAICLAIGAPAPTSAQGVTTAAIRGTVLTTSGARVEGAVVRVSNTATGYAGENRVRGDAFVFHGLPIGGPYRIVIRSLGYSAQILDGVFLSLGERRDVDVRLQALSTELDTIRVTARDDRPRLPTAGGIGASVSDSALRRLPTLNRDMYDFARLVPQAGSRFGLTGAGSSFRFNSYVIDGVSDRQLQGNNVLGGAVGGKTISLEAVKEYQVLLSPYDARYGDFTGLLVNAVTKSGTNDFHGSAYGYMRNEQLARKNSFIGGSPYRNAQFGFSIGGPIVRDRVHFFIAPEFQHAATPAPGPYIGQSADASPSIPVSLADVERFASLLRQEGMDPGNGGRVTLSNPAVTLFGRLDISLPQWKSRVVLRDNYSTVKSTRFSRAGAAFPLTSNVGTLETAKHAPAVQIFTQPWTGVSNEFMAAYLNRPQFFTPQTRTSFIQATVPAAGGVALTALSAGAPAAFGGNSVTQILVEIADHLEFEIGSRHTVGVGTHLELFRYHSDGARGSLGQWRFSSLDALAAREASFFQIGKDFGTGDAPVNGLQPSAYVTDEWRIADRLSLTLGLRADALRFSSQPAYNSAVDSLFQRRTSDYPRPRLQWSPRLGFNWQPFGDDVTRVRGGAGIFVARPPLGWLLGPSRHNGAGVKTLTCNAQRGDKVPKFIADPLLQPDRCADGRGFSDGPVALVDRNLRMAESFRASLGIDRRLPWNVGASLDALYSRVRSDFIFVNSNLRGPQGMDSHGRILYGSIRPTGAAAPALVASGRFPEAIDLRNHSLGHSWAVTAQVDKPFSDRVELRASYTHSRSRDVQSLTNISAVAPLDIWAGGRPVSGRHDELSTGVSSFEIPHRVVLSVTHVARWKRVRTDFSLYYIGESGSPFTFGDSTAGGLGDLNADGTSANDPIYVPRDAADPGEIALAGNDVAGQAAALERFIRETPCLLRQRGKIVDRNSCRGPWVNTSNASLRQSLPAMRGRDLAVQLEVFNVLNLLNPSWGQFQIPNSTLLQHVGQTSGATPQPMFYFDAARSGTSTQNVESGYQLQLSLRYSF